MMSALKIIVQFPGGNRIYYTEVPTNYWDLLSFMQHNISCNVDHYLKYWIDKENDIVEINNQASYKMFVQLSNCQKLFLATEEKLERQKPIETEALANKQIEINGESNDKDYKLLTIHTGIECSNCKTAPIVGFRYKCQHCEEYDLCMKCESNYVHSHHKMLRLPDELKSSKKKKKRSKANGSPNETTEDTAKDELNDEIKTEKITDKVQNLNEQENIKDSIDQNLNEHENIKHSIDDFPKEKIECDQIKTTAYVVKNESKNEIKKDDIVKEKVKINECNIIENINHDKMKISNKNIPNNSSSSSQSNVSEYDYDKTSESFLENNKTEAIRRRRLEQLRYNNSDYMSSRLSNQMSENFIRETPREKLDNWEIMKYVLLFIVIIWVSSLFSRPSIG